MPSVPYMAGSVKISTFKNIHERRDYESRLWVHIPENVEKNSGR